MPKYYIKTFGCQMNFSDSERLASFLESHSFQPTKEITKANLVIFNSCGVRKMAEDRAFGQIHNLRKKNPKIKIALTGCISQRKDVQAILNQKVDLFFSIKDFSLLKNFLDKLKIQNLKFEIQNYPTDKEFIDYLSINPKYTNTFQAFVPVMTGCNNFCSYCVVPYARGRETSRSAEEIIAEVNTLIKNGYKEITLLGQNVNSYSDKKINFSQLLRMINAIEGNFWIRFMTSHPKDMSTELIKTVTQLEKVCESVHLPIQSGDNKVLKNMNRKYTREHYLTLIDKIKKGFATNKPNEIYSLSSDIIVGFPGETKAQLEKSAQIMRQVKYDMVYFGQFSPRPETVAWEMKDNMSKIEKERREKYLNEILKKTALAHNKEYLGKTLEVLIDTLNPNDPLKSPILTQTYFGKTRTLKNVKIISDKKNIVGQFIKVQITKANIWSLEGSF